MIPFRHSHRPPSSALESGRLPGTAVRRKIQVRFGATLTEVLISLLIMGIGVTSVFTLFPLSVLRSIQATQRTNAKILFLNAAETFAANPNIFNLHSPPPGVTPNAKSRFRGQWQPDQVYTIGDIVVPTIKPGSVYPSPNLWFTCIDARDNTGNPPDGHSGITEPTWNVSAAINDFNVFRNEVVVWQAQPFVYTNQGVYPDDQVPVFPDPWNFNAEYSIRGYVVDPLGWAIAQSERYVPLAYEFGNNADTTTGVGQGLNLLGWERAHLLRINGGYNTEQLAAAATSLQDTWEEVVRATPGAASATSVTFPPTIDLANIGGLRRVILTSMDGSMTVTRDVFNIAGQVVNWTPQTPLPARFPGVAAGTPDVGMARIEVFDRRYTWFATVKKDRDGNTVTKVVVVFKRAFTAADENVYFANFSNPTLDMDFDGVPDGPQHGLSAASRDWVLITWNPGTNFVGHFNAPAPNLKPGGFLLDVRNVEWYRIREIIDEQGAANGLHHAVLHLDRTVTTVTPDDGSGPPSKWTDGFGLAITMRGIVDVFEL